MSSGRRYRNGSEKEDISADSDRSQENSAMTPKRSVRIRQKVKKYGDFIELSPTRRKSRVDNESSDEDVIKQSCSEKPTALFFSDDVDGQDMFKFKSQHTKNHLHNMVKTAVNNSPLCTPKKLLNHLRKSEATPKQVNEIMKKRIIREVESESAESDFSDGSSSDFVPEKCDEESISSSASECAEENEEESSEPSEREDEQPRKAEKMKIVISKEKGTKPKDSEYVVTPDNYFMMHSTKKITTSDHTLAKLKSMNLDEERDASTFISDEHKQKVVELIQSYEQLFNRWLYVLSEDFNVILYGIGSKRAVINQFQAQRLNELPCVVVNGFFPSLTIKSVLESVIIDLLDNTRVPSNVSDAINLIDSQLRENNIDLFLIIHNIDGVMLRNAKTQSAFANLSRLSNVHTVATIDHINAPLLWDHSKLSKFNFTWWDVTTFLPYTEETSFENSLMTHRKGTLQLSSLKSVYQSLTTNARGIFNIIIQYQLDNHKQGHYQGLPFKDLYSKSREQFLVSSDLALRAQLTEFLDHKLVKIKRTFDGSENLVIPIDSALLQQFLEQQNN